MILFYREDETGDFLAVDTATNGYYLGNFGLDQFEGRATAIVGCTGSVCTIGISRQFLETSCQPVARQRVPPRWRQAIGV